MKIIQWKKVLPLMLIILFSTYKIFAQVEVVRSKDKVIISGIQYFIHDVKKGETAYSISRAYGISVEELTRENPQAVYGVKEGQILRILVKSVTDSLPSQSAPKLIHDDSKFIYHKLNIGETVYFLSKSYGVSENDIIQSNPGIDINKLTVGTELAIPRREFMTERQKFDDQEKKYTYHKVLQGESLSSIADRYGLTLRELRRENRNLRFPQVGDFVRVPITNIAEIVVPEPDITDSAAVDVQETIELLTKPSEFVPVGKLNGSLDIAVLLPFYLKGNSVRIEIDSSKIVKGRKQYKQVKRPEEWIYPMSLDFIEMYEGILLAADTLRSLGLTINLYPYDIKSDTIELTRLLQSGKLRNMDLIIGPVYSYNLSKVAAYARGFDIPVVSPVSLINNSALNNNPTLFMANSSLEVAQIALAKKIGEFYDNNIVFIHSDTASVDDDVKRFKNFIFSELTYRMPYEDIKFKEMFFYSRSTFGNDSINRLSHALSEQNKNIVIIASEETPVISESITEVIGLSKKFDIKVFGYPVLRDIDNLDPTYLFDLDLLTYSPYWIDYNKSDVKNFIKDFRQKFLTEPAEKSYAWEGYDVAYYFMSGIAKFGKDFVRNPSIHYPDLLQSDFEFIRKGPIDGFENQKLFPVRYTKEYEIRLEKDTTDLPIKWGY